MRKRKYRAFPGTHIQKIEILPSGKKGKIL